MILLDPDLPEDIRQDGAGELEELFEQEDLILYVESVLYARPLPADADLSGGLSLARAVAAREVSSLLGKLEASQHVIAEVRRAWEAIPPESFGNEQQYWQFVAVREGFFRQLVLHRSAGKSANAFFVDAAMRPALRSLPNSRGVLQAWIGPFLRHYDVYRDRMRVSEQPQVVREGRSEYRGRKTFDHAGQRELSVIQDELEDLRRQAPKPSSDAWASYLMRLNRLRRELLLDHPDAQEVRRRVAAQIDRAMGLLEDGSA